jgi:NitT/TauT family transport system ATP-binding protein
MTLPIAAESAPASLDCVIDVADLSLTFQTRDGPVQALSKISLKVNRGEFVSFIGPSGCGKTTLLRAIADLEAPTGGVLRVNGLSAQEARANRAYGYVFQAPGLFAWRTVARNIALPLEIMGYPKDECDERVKKGLELVNLTGFGNKYPWQLSGGMQQRAQLCRALIHEPSILLLDEPFAALDTFTREELWDVLQELWAFRKCTIVLVTHELREAVFLAQTVHVMSARPGRIIKTRSVDLPRPCTLASTFTPHFVELVQDLRNHIGPGKQP